LLPLLYYLLFLFSVVRLTFLLARVFLTFSSDWFVSFDSDRDELRPEVDALDFDSMSSCTSSNGVPRLEALTKPEKDDVLHILH